MKFFHWCNISLYIIKFWERWLEDALCRFSSANLTIYKMCRNMNHCNIEFSLLFNLKPPWPHFCIIYFKCVDLDKLIHHLWNRYASVVSNFTLMSFRTFYSLSFLFAGNCLRSLCHNLQSKQSYHFPALDCIISLYHGYCDNVFVTLKFFFPS